MSSVKKSLLAGVAAAALCGGQAGAADYPSPPPPQQVIYQQVPVPVPVRVFDGWYLRGDIGVTNQQVGSLDNVLYATTPGLQQVDRGFDSSMLFGLGVGYQFNDWFRGDITGEYRSSANFHGLDIYPGGTDEYRARKYEWTFLANAYIDLGTWWCITPFIGAGVGFSYNTVASFTDINTATNGVAYAEDTGKFNFAWALHAGLAYKVNPNFTVELAYRYINLGDAESGDIKTYDGINTVNNPMQFKDLTSHDIKFGVRWNLQDSTPGIAPAVYAPPPAPVIAQPQQQVITMPQQVITAPPPPPAPVYAQPQPLYQPQYTPAPPPVYHQQPQYAPPPQQNWQYQQQPPLMRRG